jgi:hypothetical protein
MDEEAAAARAYIAHFRKYIVPGTDHVVTSEGRHIMLDDMTDDDAVFVGAEFARMEAEAAKRRRMRNSYSSASFIISSTCSI